MSGKFAIGVAYRECPVTSSGDPEARVASMMAKFTVIPACSSETGLWLGSRRTA